jgi:ATP-binding cassette subfamily B protein
MMMFGVIALLAAATYTRFYNVSWLGERVTADLRRRVFDHLLTLPPSWFEAGRTGAVISRLTSDTTLIENAVGSSLSIALRNLLILIGGLVMLFTTNLKLTLLVLGGVPLVVAPIVLFGRACGASRASARTAWPTWATASTRPSTRSASSRPTATRPPTGATSAGLIERGFATALARIRNRATLVAVVLVLVFGAISLILWVGGHDVLAGRSRRGSSRPSSSTPRWWRFGRRPVRILGRPAARRRRHRAPAGTARPHRPDVAVPGQRRLPCRRGRAARSPSRRRFRYPSRPDTPALDDFSLRVAPGETWPWWAPRAPARPRCSSCCCASTIRSPASCCSTACRWPRPTRWRCAAPSRWCRRRR